MVKVRVEISPLQKILRGVERQSKFGTSQALNELVDVIKLRSIDRLPKYFKVRSGWNAQGFRTGHAKRDMLTAWVGHLDNMNKTNADHYMQRQAEGGTKPVGMAGFGQGIPQKGVTSGGIPMPRGSSGERPTYRGSNWPKQLIAAVRMFERKLAAARGQRTKGRRAQGERTAANTRAAQNQLVFLRHAKVPTLAIRIGKGQGKGNYLPLWFLKNAPVKIPKRWMFYEDGETFAKSNLPPLMDWHITKWITKIGAP